MLPCRAFGRGKRAGCDSPSSAAVRGSCSLQDFKNQAIEQRQGGEQPRCHDLTAGSEIVGSRPWQG